MRYRRHPICSIASILVPVTMAVAAVGTSFAGSVSVPPDVSKWALYAPQPHYPAVAVTRRASGAGIFVLRVRIKTGLVKAVEVARTTGDADLDAAAIKALGQWRFKPGALPPISVVHPHRKDQFANEDSLVKAPVNFIL